MTGDGKNIRMYFYVKITYSNGKVIRYKEFPMKTYEEGVKDHYIKDIKPLNWWEMTFIDIASWLRGFVK